MELSILERSIRPLHEGVLPTTVDVLVLGGGPAGLATAIFLAQNGYKVLVATRKIITIPKIGESLAPVARKLLQNLGIWTEFLADGHLPCYAHKSAWGSNRLDYHDFIQNPWGTAWHLDRIKFEQRLLWQAQRVGVQCFTEARLATTTWQQNSQSHYWRVYWSKVSTPLITSFIVDATGSSSYFAHLQGVYRHYQDRQVALATFLTPSATPLTDHTTLVESTSHGWWYSSILPNGQLATMFTTDLDLYDRHQFCQSENWTTLLKTTYYTANRIQENHYNLVSRPQLINIESSNLTQISGNGWLAVGDAAITYDPLAAHGLTMALTSGRDAAIAITGYFSRQPAALTNYHNQMQEAFAHYKVTRRQLYAAEGRWPNSSYWQQRLRL